jgi:hypothetical protein
MQTLLGTMSPLPKLIGLLAASGALLALAYTVYGRRDL